MRIETEGRQTKKWLERFPTNQDSLKPERRTQCPTNISPLPRRLLLLGRRRRFLVARTIRGSSFLSYRQTQRVLHLILNLPQGLRIVLHRLLRVFAALAETLAFIREPRAALFDDAVIGCEVEQVAFF